MSNVIKAMNVRYREEARIVDTNDRADELIREYIEKNGIVPLGYGDETSDFGDEYNSAGTEYYRGEENFKDFSTASQQNASGVSSGVSGADGEDEYEYYIDPDDEWGIPVKRKKQKPEQEQTAAKLPDEEEFETGIGSVSEVSKKQPEPEIMQNNAEFAPGIKPAAVISEQDAENSRRRARSLEEANEEAKLASEEIIRQSEEAKKKIEEESALIILQAKEEVKKIMQQAVIDAETRKLELYEQAKADGYAAGIASAAEEIEAARHEIDERDAARYADYERQVANLEPAFVNVVISLVQKLTGVEAEDNKEIIFHLLHQAMLNQSSSTSFIIRVSKSDYEFVSSKKETILGHMKKNSVVEIIEDNLLEKNQCLIETESRIIDCSLDVQLRNLIKDLRLLSGADK